MGSGSKLKGVLGVATGGAYNALTASKAQQQALQAQNLAMAMAQAEQAHAQERALKQQELAQEQANQANEKASRATATINREVKDTKNSADLTGGIAKKAKTQGASLGSDESLGLDENKDWF